VQATQLEKHQVWAFVMVKRYGEKHQRKSPAETEMMQREPDLARM
jgi:hypothetical protein